MSRPTVQFKVLVIKPRFIIGIGKIGLNNISSNYNYSLKLLQHWQ